jgi:hypothetical protein
MSVSERQCGWLIGMIECGGNGAIWTAVARQIRAAWRMYDDRPTREQWARMCEAGRMELWHTSGIWVTPPRPPLSPYGDERRPDGELRYRLDGDRVVDTQPKEPTDGDI